MADQFSVGVGGITLSAGVAKTVIELQGAATRRAYLKSVAVSFNGTTSDTPVLVEIIRATAGITGTTITPAQIDPASPAALATVKHTATVEGTAASVALETYYVTPNGGLFAVQIPLGDEYIATSASFLRVRCNAPSGETCAVELRFEE